MSVLELGTFNHLGLVVRNIEETAAFYTDVLGIGPFTVDTYYLKDVKYRGEPVEATVRGGFGYHGDLMVELVEVVEGETPHTEFLAARGPGVQHLAFPVADMKQALAALAERGILPTLEYQFIAHDAPISDPDPTKRRPMQVWEAYLDTEEQAGGVTIQLMEIKEVSDDSDVHYVANPANA
jgi:methylmalonyl-CoA/ethylmalonyl-CoA epimerase